LLLALLPACSSVEVQSDYAPGTDFSALETYVWIPATPTAEFNEMVIDRVEAAVDEVLAAKGLRAVDKESADFLVSQKVMVEEKLEVTDPYFAFGQYRTYEEGTLLLDFIDAKSGKVLWRGTGMVRLKELKTPEKREKRVRKVVEAILAKYPPS
jgi:hypothetical protein